MVRDRPVSYLNAAVPSQTETRSTSLPPSCGPMTPYSEIKPFSILIPDEQLNQLHAKLELTRLPDELDLPASQEWEWGIPLAVLKPVIDY
ncbi:epoxide hydrolase amino-terminal protein, partial [Rhizoctonia solani AG-3 Rhs1AP]